MRFYFFIVLVILSGCNGNEGFFNDQLIRFEESFEKSRLENLKSENERVFVEKTWEVEGIKFLKTFNETEEGKNLVKFFNEKGLYNNEIILEIIIVSLHRKINSEEIDLQSEINKKKLLKYSPVKCKMNKKAIARDKFLKYDYNDTVVISYPVHKIDGDFNAYYNNCPEKNCNSLEGRVLKVKGVIVKKYLSRDSSEYFFDVRIYEMTNLKTRILSNTYKKNDFLRVNINHACIALR